MENLLIKKGKKIVGFVGKNSDGWFYAFGKPSQQGGYLAFKCESPIEGVNKVKTQTSGLPFLKTIDFIHSSKN